MKSHLECSSQSPKERSWWSSCLPFDIGASLHPWVSSHKLMSGFRQWLDRWSLCLVADNIDVWVELWNRRVECFWEFKWLAADIPVPGGSQSCHAPSGRLDWGPQIGMFPNLPPLSNTSYLGGGSLVGGNSLVGSGNHNLLGQQDLGRNQQDAGLRWRGLDLQPEIPQTRNFNMHASSSALYTPQFSSDHSANPSHLSEALLSVDIPDDFKPAREMAPLPIPMPGPKLDSARPSKASSRHAEKIEREREKAEKLKEKNKRAQRKFRQRQKVRLCVENHLSSIPFMTAHHHDFI